MKAEFIVRASIFTVGAVALTVFPAASGPWHAPAPDPHPPTMPERVERTAFLGPAALIEALGLGNSAIAPDASPQQAEGVPREFYFSRGQYNVSSGGGFRRRGRGGGWAMDYPKADQIFLSFIDRLLPNLDAHEREHPVRLDDPELRRFPFLYMLEVGGMRLTPPEIEGLRDYLFAGGFLVIDDFWGTRQWANWEYEIQAVFPDHGMVDLTLDHPIYKAFYEIDEIIQVPGVRAACNGGPTYEQDGYVPVVKGIHDDKGRLMVIINAHTDLGDAWEHADDPCYPLRYSTYAYEMGVNFIVYAMSH